MKYINYIILFSLCAILFVADAQAGNTDRVGQAGAMELLLNPWARSSGFNSMNSATVQGIEAMRLNAGGLARMGLGSMNEESKTQVLFSSTQYLSGSGVSLSAFGFGQRMGESGVLGLNVVSMGFGEQDVTTISAPEGGTGATFEIQLVNLGVSYARSFSNSIHVGFVGRMISESIFDVTASGIAFDMGIQYVTGPQDNVHFGVSLRNIGTPLQFKGDGLSVKLPVNGGYNITVNNQADRFELPSVLNIGVGYDMHLDSADRHVLSFVGNFTSNAFNKDYLGAGISYTYNKRFSVRAAYRYEDGIDGDLDFTQRTSEFTGLSAGVSVEVPIKEGGSSIGFDYAYRGTASYNNNHTIGVRLNL
ncbi:MAG: PorV/PorQ family protein [Chitinophagales bacterium]